MSLDLTPGAGNLLEEFYWEILSPWRGGSWILNTGPAPRSGAAGSTLWSIMEARPHPRYFLTRKACAGIIRRASERGKPLPPQLQQALEIQAGLRDVEDNQPPIAFHINQRDEGIDLKGVSGALMATRNMQMQTFVTQQISEAQVGFDGYNGVITGDVSATLGTNCGMSTGRNGVIQPMAFTQNQRDEVRDLHDVADALGSQPGMKQQTYVASGVVTKGNGDCFLTENVHTSLSAGGGQAGQGYPCVLCLNDQGGQVMNHSENVTGTLRAQMHHHQPLVLESNQNHAVIRDDGKSPTLPASMGMGGGYVPMIYDNHGVDSRYTGPHPVSPTITARAGTGGNNLPLIGNEASLLCISDNTLNQEPNDCDGGACPNQVNLIRRLTPLECERLQGFPDGWTNIPSASDSGRYKALGNSVAIPCVEYVMSGIALVYAADINKERRRQGRTVARVLAA